jgi:hypothetical protein
MSEDTYPLETLELVYKEVDSALNRQFQSLDGLNTKASVIVGFIGVILGISLNLYPHSNPYLFGSCMTLFLISIFFALSAYKVESYRRDPEPRKLTENYLKEDSEKVKKKLIDNFIQSVEDNKIKINKKVKYINYSLVLLYIGLIVLTLSILLE